MTDTNKQELPPLPKKRRGFLCTKCMWHVCARGQEHEKHPECARCGYQGFAEDKNYDDEEMRDYALTALAATQTAKPEPEQVAIPDDVMKAATSLRANDYRGHLALAKTVIDWVANYTTPQPARMLTREEIMQAVARGWCHPPNATKEMDADLALAISAEILDAITKSGITAREATQPAKPEPIDLLARLDAAEKDAARYREIREGSCDVHGDVYAMVFAADGDFVGYGSNLDGFVDAAMKGKR